MQAQAGKGHEQRQATLPGIALGALIAALTALLVGFRLLPGTPPVNVTASASASSELAGVAPGETEAALQTLVARRDALDQLRKPEACRRRLAAVTVRAAPGAPPGKIRLTSGGYSTPAFAISQSPVRIALPYPAPYATGRGTLAVAGSTTDALIALTPPWSVQGGGFAAHTVTWTAAGCASPAP